MNNIKIYRDKQNEWRWQAVANMHVVADSGQGYKTRQGVIKGLKATNKAIMETLHRLLK